MITPTTEVSSGPRWLLIGLFAISGFSGLIYESIWAQYLKLLLGHAAYAHTLVLTIFMGGMAIGSWWVGRRTHKVRNLLIVYAIVEGIIGIAALLFHGAFTGALDFAQTSLFPQMDSAASIGLLKWGFAALLILPQSILLGMTFPLMSGALLRRYPQAQGRGIAALYFSNSLGAAVGVLASGFVLLPAAGLPGTVLVAGVINVVLAAFVYLLARTSGWQHSAPAAPPSADVESGDASPRLFLTVAALTGLASFIYEIVWIRMLSMVLGASTHAFELMLSAFILGLALGSLWVQSRIQRLREPVRFLGIVQIVMGVLAMGTLLIYGQTFGAMASMMQGLERSDAGYTLFNIASHLVAMSVMLPVTICAGMTLPLITFSLLRKGFGERSIGHVYAANTAGAIVGVLLAVHIGLPLAGLKFTIIAAAAIDIVLGVVLLRGFLRESVWRGAAVTMALLVCVGGVMLELDPKRMASGVFRYGELGQLDDATVEYAGDGKTATVHVVRYPVGVYGIMTNGKTDSSLQLGDGDDDLHSLDEYNMALLSVLPQAAHPRPRRAAVIGFGAGLSTHVMLANPDLEVVDTIEIEPRMVEASRLFHARVSRSFDDPRSVFRYEDARTFFAASRKPYDVIVSEPSTPWVSGVASLFTAEFYGHVKRNLAEDGLFAQWLHGSELSMELTALVARTLGLVFDDYVVFNLNGHDAVFVASVKGKVNVDSAWPFKIAALRDEMAKVHLKDPEDLRIRYLGDRALLEPWFRSFGASHNSDYFPLLDQSAVRARFKREFATDLYNLRRLSVPVVEMLAPAWALRDERSITATQQFDQAAAVLAATRFTTLITTPADTQGSTGQPSLDEQLPITRLALTQCGNPVARALWFQQSRFVGTTILPLITRAHAVQLLSHMRSACGDADQKQQRWLELLDAIGQRDAKRMSSLSRELLTAGYDQAEAPTSFLVAAGMLGDAADGREADALRLWQALNDDPLRVRDTLEVRLLHGYALGKLETISN